MSLDAVGAEPRDPGIPLIDIPNNAPSTTTSISENSQLSTAEEQANVSSNVQPEYAPIEHHNSLAEIAISGGFAKKDPPVSNGRYFKTEVEYAIYPLYVTLS